MVFKKGQFGIVVLATLGGVAIGMAAGWMLIDGLPEHLREKIAWLLLIVGIGLFVGAWSSKMLQDPAAR